MKMKTIDVVNAFAALNGAKLANMEDKEKFTLIKAMKVLKPIKNDYEDFAKDAREKLKGDNHEDMLKRVEEWRAKHADTKPGDFTPAELKELNEINAYFGDYNKKVEECVKEEADKDVTPEYARLSEDAFGRLLASNEDWDVEKVMLAAEILCE